MHSRPVFKSPVLVHCCGGRRVHIKRCVCFCVQGVYEGTLHCCGVQILSDTQSQSCSLISAHLLLTPPGSQLCCVLISCTVSVLSVCPWTYPARLLWVFLEILNATEFVFCAVETEIHTSVHPCLCQPPILYVKRGIWVWYVCLRG